MKTDKEPTTRESKGVWRVQRTNGDSIKGVSFVDVGDAFPDQAAALKWIRNEAPAGTYTPIKCWPSVTVAVEMREVRAVK